MVLLASKQMGQLINTCYEYVPILTENMPGVVDVRFVEKEPAEKRSLLSWEQVKDGAIYDKYICSVIHCYHITMLYFFLRKTLVFCQRTCEISI